MLTRGYVKLLLAVIVVLVVIGLLFWLSGFGEEELGTPMDINYLLEVQDVGIEPAQTGETGQVGR